MSANAVKISPPFLNNPTTPIPPSHAHSSPQIPLYLPMGRIMFEHDESLGWTRDDAALKCHAARDSATSQIFPALATYRWPQV